MYLKKSSSMKETDQIEKIMLEKNRLIWREGAKENLKKKKNPHTP